MHVAVGIIRDGRGRVLLSRRHPESHQGGLWEFAGGKLEAGETPEQALSRELMEELGIRPGPLRPLLKVQHDYGDRRVLLDVWTLESFTGTPEGLEGQALAWVKPAELERYEFPPANRPIVEALLAGLDG